MRGGGARSEPAIVASAVLISRPCLRRNSDCARGLCVVSAGSVFACLGIGTATTRPARPVKFRRKPKCLRLQHADDQDEGRRNAFLQVQPAHGDGPATFGIMPAVDHSSLPAGTAESSRPCASLAFGRPIGPGNSELNADAGRRSEEEPVTPDRETGIFKWWRR